MADTRSRDLKSIHSDKILYFTFMTIMLYKYKGDTAFKIY